MRPRDLGVGIVGCGNISAAYMRLAPLFRGMKITACADIDMEATAARAEEFGLRASTVAELMDASDIDIVVNLTIPAAHFEVSDRALEAGKHIYSEKPFVLSVKEGKALARKAARKGLRIGSAPDTFLGGAHQQARHLIDSGAIGRVTSGTAFVMSHGMEHWHPNPGFFFRPGAGPVLDVGPYYVTNLIQLVGPVTRVAALAATPSTTRTISSQPRAGQRIRVETPTTLQALLEFDSGATVMFGASWDVWNHEHGHMELYGEEGTIFVPDPNFFGGEVRMTRAGRPARRLPKFNHALGIPNQKHGQGMMANYRAAGLADMALAILEDRPHRCSLELALHAVDVMTAILKSGEGGRFVSMTTTCDQPAPLDPRQARALIARKPAKK